MKSQIGVIGLGVMGKSLALNLLRNEFTVSGFTEDFEITQKIKESHEDSFTACRTIEEFIDSLETPRKIILMVPAGEPVRSLVNELKDKLDSDDILMDCGNSHFLDTVDHHDTLKEYGIHYFGVGVSGGEQGALHGPSIMPGGNKDIYPQIATFLEKIAAQKDGVPCCSYIGPNGAGHFVKMVHNGIEYADMQLIAEIYLLFKYAHNLTNAEISNIFHEWNDTEVGSYLIEITSKILLERDPQSLNDLVDMIVDRASQKGTGKWTIIESAELSQYISSIQTAVDNRIISGDRSRKYLFETFKNANNLDFSLPFPSVEEVRKAYYVGKLVAYAQGFSLYTKASEHYQWDLNLSKIASIFRAGCIIQAKLLDTLMRLYQSEPNLTNFLVSLSMLDILKNNIDSLRYLNIIATLNEIPNPTLSASLIYLDQLKSKSVGANLIQAQRDFFGAHTFERIDKTGVFHHEWKN